MSILGTSWSGFGIASGVQGSRPWRSHGFLGSRQFTLCGTSGGTSGVPAESTIAGTIVGGRSLVGCIADTILRTKRGSLIPTC